MALMLTRSFAGSGFGNYARVFEKINPLPNFNTSLIVVSGSLLIVSVVTSMAAFAFSKVPFAGRSALYLLLLMGMMVPTAATIFPLFQIVRA